MISPSHQEFSSQHVTVVVVRAVFFALGKAEKAAAAGLNVDVFKKDDIEIRVYFLAKRLFKLLHDSPGWIFCAGWPLWR